MKTPPCKPGDRIRLIQMSADPCPIAPGATGTVHSLETGFGRGAVQITVNWDAHIKRSLALVWPVDTFEVIEPASA